MLSATGVWCTSTFKLIFNSSLYVLCSSSSANVVRIQTITYAVACLFLCFHNTQRSRLVSPNVLYFPHVKWKPFIMLSLNRALARVAQIHHEKRVFRSLSVVNLAEIRASKRKEIGKLAEVIERQRFIDELKYRDGESTRGPPRDDANAIVRYDDSNISHDTIRKVLKAGFTTFLLHVEARIASSLGVG